MNIKSILSSVFALALVAGFGVSQAAYASDHGDSSSSAGYAAGDACTCGSLTGTWVASSSSDSSSSSSDSSSSSSDSSSSSSDSSSSSSDSSSSSSDSSSVSGSCQCSGFGTVPVGAPPATFQPL